LIKTLSNSAIIRSTLILALFSLFLASCTPAPMYRGDRGSNATARRAASAVSSGLEPAESFRVGQVLTGEASYYGPGFHGKLTANGETYNQNDMTCAHKTLPFNTKLRITLTATGKSVVVRVNDRGPYKRNRMLDLSVEAARRLGLTEMGTGEIKAQIISLGEL